MASKAKGASSKKSTGGKRPKYNTSFNFGPNRKSSSGGVVEVGPAVAVAATGALNRCKYLVSIEEVEKLTGHSFFDKLPEKVAAELRKKGAEPVEK